MTKKDALALLAIFLGEFYIFFFFRDKKGNVSNSNSMSGKRKRSEGSPNEDIVSVLLELAEWERNTNRATHKANAYKKAAAVIGALDHRYKHKVLPKLPLICFRGFLKIFWSQYEKNRINSS